MTLPKILNATWPYFHKLLRYHNVKFEFTYSDPCTWGGDQIKVEGFKDYNFLADINLCLSTRPGGLLRDRTKTIKFPFLVHSSGHWVAPTKSVGLEDCFFHRVKNLESQYEVINLLWSGGIDSTAMVVAWLKYSGNNSKTRVLYTLDSIKENTEFFLHLQTILNIELVEIGGKVFYQNDLDGVEIHGGAGDDLTASIDESFFSTHQWWTLQSPWRDFFWKKNPNQNFINFCEKWFACSGRDIDTVLEARWWFYLNKMAPPGPSRIIKKTHKTVESFYDDPLFTTHFFYNIDSLFASTSWKSYKQSIKNFIYDYYPDADYRDNKCKENSGGYTIFRNKSDYLNQTENICTLSDGTLIKTDHLPFLSRIEYRQKYGDKFNYLFNQ
jgi:hypothetical protein